MPELARLLKVAENSFDTIAQRGDELPAFKVRGQWRSRRAELDLGIEHQKVVSRVGDVDGERS